MVHDQPDVIQGPATLDQITVRFDEQRLVSDAGLLLTGSLAERLDVEQLVNDSVWLDSRAPGAALPGRKVMSLVHGMLAGADSIDDMNVLRAGSTELVLGHTVMAPSTLGTFLRAFTFGHVRQLDHVLDESICRAWAAGAGPGSERLVIDIDSFVGEVHGYQKQGASYGYTKQLGYHPLVATRAGTGEVLHIRNRKGKANTQRGNPRFVDELLARVRRAGASGKILIRADTGFENHKLFKTLDARGVEFSIGVKQRKPIRALIDLIDENADWMTLAGLSRGRGGPDRRDQAPWLAADRTPHTPGRQAGRPVPQLAILRVRDQPHRAAAPGRGRASRARRRRTLHPRSQRPSARALPLRPVRRQQRLDRDRRPRAQPRTVDQPDRPAPRQHPHRRHPPAPAVPDPRATDPHRPAMDTPDARPLALATRLPRRAHPHPRAPRPHLTPPGATSTPNQQRRRQRRATPTENVTANRHQPAHERSRGRTSPEPASQTPTDNQSARLRVTPPRDSGLYEELCRHRAKESPCLRQRRTHRAAVPCWCRIRGWMRPGSGARWRAVPLPSPPPLACRPR